MYTEYPIYSDKPKSGKNVEKGEKMGKIGRNDLKNIQ